MLAAGFELVWATSFVTFLLPLIAASRLLTRRRPYSLDREFGLPRPVDRLFERSLDLERAAMSRGVSFPVGGSLLLVARRPGIAAMSEIPFNRPFTTGREFDYVREAIENGHLSGSGPFTERCSRWLKQRVGSDQVLLTHSCTAALEMAVMLLDIGPGDEVVMPSFTFVSTANAVVLRGGTPSSSTFVRTP